MPLCTNCAQAVPYLYTVYHSVNNVRLEQCPSCRAPADPYVEHDALVVALDLILLKRGVYRHLLFNRGTPPRKAEENCHGPDKLNEQNTREKRAEDDARETTRRWLIMRVGTGVVLVDSFVRWSRLRGFNSVLPLPEFNPPTRGTEVAAFIRVLLGCFVETASFHGGITLASIVVLTSLERVARWRKRRYTPSSIRQQLRYSHISLCLFYSSLTKFMLLVILSIGGSQVRKDSPHPVYVYKMPFESPLWHVLDDDILDRTWLVRNMLGGMSAGFGLRVVLDCHPILTTLVILSGCLIKTGVVSLVRDCVGPGNGVGETWLTYSIP
ncbi:Arv1-domain-containing protein [Multifurca ochricompacta]|uniref:Protein ARV n=1 Tax=Multifurca ochricompacta TaxID=376703 RepID=A0AAD4M905_9AGAM|nr:Arv1-domain-containing protein [Multifurca ochricompacta]